MAANPGENSTTGNQGAQEDESAFLPFYEFCAKQIRGFAFNIVTDWDDDHPSLYHHVERLRRQIKDSITGIDKKRTGSGVGVVQFKLGRIPLQRKKKENGGYHLFDTRDCKTWQISTISRKWHLVHAKDGYDGMAIIGALTRAMVPTDSSGKLRYDQQQYAAAVEQTLINNCRFEDIDPRMETTIDAHEGPKDTTAIAYVIYMVYKLGKVWQF